MSSKNGVVSRWVCPFNQYTSKDIEEMECLQNSAPFVFSREWMKEERLEKALKDLKGFGCTPCVRIVDGKWRVYINNSTDMYEQSKDLPAAFRKAVRKWENSKRPTDEGKYISLHVREHKRAGKVWRQLQWRIA